MRNLKRALSLAMATFMLLGMMVVGAGATSYSDFSDGEKIVNTEAVNTMVALGVINGRDDGSYDPEGTVTRAEMAKLIAVMLNGGKDPTLGTVTTAFTDAKGHWAEAFIAYCANLGILNGYGDNTVKPDGTVTGTEAAKMLLTALGYRSDIEKLTGVQWAINTNVLANKVDLYNGLELNPAEGLTRDDTAQMIYNAVQAEEVEYRNNYGEYSGVIYAQAAGTVLENRFRVVKVEGVAVANDVFGLNYSAAPNGKVRLVDCNTYVMTNAYGNISKVAYDNVYPIDVPNEMVGRRIVIYVKFQDDLAPNAANSTVVGTPILSSKNTVVTTSSKLGNDDKVKDLLRDNDLTMGKEMVKPTSTSTEVLRGVLTVAPKVDTQFDARDVKIGDGITKGNGTKVDFIDHTGDGTVDYILHETAQLAKVTVYSESGKKLTVAGVGEINFKNVANPEDVALNDMVLWTKYSDTYYFAKPETVQGTFEAFNKDAGKMVMDGTAYGKSVVDFTRDGTTLEPYAIGEDTVGMSYTLYFDQYNNVVAVDLYEDVAPNYALVLESATLGGINNRGEVKVLLADGTVGTYTVNMLSSAARFGVNGVNDAAKEAAMSALLAKTATGGASKLVNTIVSYAFGDDNKITLGNPAHNTSYSSLTDVSLDGSATGKREAGRTISQYAFDKTKTNANGTHLVGPVVSPEGNTAVVVNDSTTFFFNDGAGSYAVVKGVNKLPSTAIKNSHLVTAIYRNVNDDQNHTAVARAVFVEGTFVGALDYLYVSAQYTNIHGKVGERIYTFPVVFEDGKAGEIKIKEGTSGIAPNSISSGEIYSYSTDNAGYTALGQKNISSMTAQVEEKALVTVDNTKGKTINGYVSTYSENGSLVMRWGMDENSTTNGGNQEMAFTLAGDAKIWNVEGDEPVATNLTANQSVVFATDSNGFIKTAFIKDTNVVFRTFKNETKAAFNIETLNRQTGVKDVHTLAVGEFIKAATGFDVTILGLNAPAAKAVSYTKSTDGGEKTDLTADGSTGDRTSTITMPSYASIVIKNIEGGTSAGGGGVTPPTGKEYKVIFYDNNYSSTTFYVDDKEVETVFEAPGKSYILVKEGQKVAIVNGTFTTTVEGTIDTDRTVVCDIDGLANSATFKMPGKAITLVAPSAASQTPGKGDLKIIFDNAEYPIANHTFKVNGTEVTPLKYVAPTRAAAADQSYFMANEGDIITITAKTVDFAATAGASYLVAEGVAGTVDSSKKILTFTIKTADIELPNRIATGADDLFNAAKKLLTVVLADGLSATNWVSGGEPYVPVVDGNTYYAPTGTTTNIVTADKMKFIAFAETADTGNLHVATGSAKNSKDLLTISDNMRVYPAVAVAFTSGNYDTAPTYKNLKGVDTTFNTTDVVAVGTPLTFEVKSGTGTGIIADETGSTVTGANLNGAYTVSNKPVALLVASMVSMGEGVEAVVGAKAITNGTFVKVTETITFAATNDNCGVIETHSLKRASKTAITTKAAAVTDLSVVAATKVEFTANVNGKYTDLSGNPHAFAKSETWYVLEGTKIDVLAEANGKTPISVKVGDFGTAEKVTEGVITGGEVDAKAHITYTVGSESLKFDIITP